MLVNFVTVSLKYTNQNGSTISTLLIFSCFTDDSEALKNHLYISKAQYKRFDIKCHHQLHRLKKKNEINIKRES